MRTGRPIAPLSLTVEERETVERWTGRPKSAQALAQRSRIVLECAAGQPNTAVAQRLGLTHQTVGKWRKRFVERRLDGLLDEPRPGAPRQVGDAQIERVVRLTLESTPADGTHWSTRAMARRSGLSQTMISRIWRAFALQRAGWRASSFRKIHCSSKKSATSWAFMWLPRTGRWCCALMRKHRFRRSIAVSRCCPCDPDRPRVERRTTCAMAPSTYSPRSTPRPAP